MTTNPPPEPLRLRVTLPGEGAKASISMLCEATDKSGIYHSHPRVVAYMNITDEGGDETQLNFTVYDRTRLKQQTALSREKASELHQAVTQFRDSLNEHLDWLEKETTK